MHHIILVHHQWAANSQTENDNAAKSGVMFRLMGCRWSQQWSWLG